MISILKEVVTIYEQLTTLSPEKLTPFRLTRSVSFVLFSMRNTPTGMFPTPAGAKQPTNASGVAVSVGGSGVAVTVGVGVSVGGGGVGVLVGSGVAVGWAVRVPATIVPLMALTVAGMS